MRGVSAPGPPPGVLQPALTQFQGLAYVAMIAFAVTLVVSFVVLFRLFFAPDTRDDRDG